MDKGGVQMIPITEALDLFACSSVGQWLLVALVFVLAIRLLGHM